MSRGLLPALLAVSLLCTGCSGRAADAVGARPAAPAAIAPAVTAPESVKILNDFATAFSQATDARAVRATVGGPLADVAVAQFKLAHGKATRISLVNPVMYVPRLAGYPKWFAAAALQEHPGGGAGTEVVLLFAQGAAGEPWRPVHRLPFSGRPPEIATDGQGYAIPVSGDLRISGLHTGFLNGTTAPGFTPDAFSRTARSNGAFTDAGFASYGLQTKDGGALVWYTLRQTQRFTGTPPQTVQAYLGRTTATEATLIWQTIGYLPAKGSAAVLGESITVTQAR